MARQFIRVVSPEGTFELGSDKVWRSKDAPALAHADPSLAKFLFGILTGALR